MKKIFIFLIFMFIIVIFFLFQTQACNDGDKLTMIVNFKPADANCGMFTAKCGSKIYFWGEGGSIRSGDITNMEDEKIIGYARDAYCFTGNDSFVFYLKSDATDISRLVRLDVESGHKTYGFSTDRIARPLVNWGDTLVRSDGRYYNVGSEEMDQMDFVDVHDLDVKPDNTCIALEKVTEIGQAEVYYLFDNGSYWTNIDANGNIPRFPDDGHYQLFHYQSRL